MLGGRGRYPSGDTAVALMYASHALIVGVHTLAFWKTMRSLGTVPTAISKGAQQAGTFLLAHILFCKADRTECIEITIYLGARRVVLRTAGTFFHRCMTDNHGSTSAWGRSQKPVSFVVCCLGCFIYAIIKKRERRAAAADPRKHVQQVEQQGQE
jgi:hypothetical protein